MDTPSRQTPTDWTVRLVAFTAALVKEHPGFSILMAETELTITGKLFQARVTLEFLRKPSGRLDFAQMVPSVTFFAENFSTRPLEQVDPWLEEASRFVELMRVVRREFAGVVIELRGAP